MSDPIAERFMQPVASPLLSYLRLFRFPNVFTAFADIAMGYCFVRGAMTPNGSLVALLLSSGFLYTAGMVLNDVYDIDVDRRERPQRPLPSGAIDPDWARSLGYCFLAIGVALAWIAPWFDVTSVKDMAVLRSGVVGSLLAACVVFYDRIAKSTALGPVVMGACRFLNVLLGMSIASTEPLPVQQLWGFTAPQATVALGIGVYIVGVTVFARAEATISHRLMLLAGLAIVVGGLALLAIFPRLGEIRPLAIAQPVWWPAVVAILGLFVIRPSLRALVKPHPRIVQAAVKHFIVSLITLDAAVTFAMAGMAPSMIVLALLAPMLILGKWVYST